jgi:hypothetical protein
MLGRLLDRLLNRRRAPAPRRSTAARSDAGPTDWADTRSPPSQFDLSLLPLTEEWLASLPRWAQPKALAEQHRRLTNRLALCWSDPALAERVLDDLIVDKRGGRRGFSVEVAAELLALREELMRRERLRQKAKPPSSR